MPKGVSRAKKADRRARALARVRLWLVAAAALLVAFLALCEFVASGRAAELVAAVFGPRDLTPAAERIDAAVDAALVKLGIVDVVSKSEERADTLHKVIHWEKRGRIPRGVSLFECNLAITQAVRRAGGRVVRVREIGPDWQRLLTLDMRFGYRGIETHRIVLKETAADETSSTGGPGGRPRVAIVIDDFGYSESKTVLGFLSLDAPLSISVLPGCPYTRRLAEEAHAAGKEVLVHLPMEPEGYPDVNPGDGALMLDQSREEIVRLVRAAVDDVPYAAGANNHMGSAFTKDRVRMRAVMGVLKERGLFFVDSMTTPQSTGYAEARREGVPSVRNNMFIDSRLDELGRVDVLSQLRELEAVARKRGAAVGIGHPKPETLRVLSSAVREMSDRGVEFVFVSELTE